MPQMRLLQTIQGIQGVAAGGTATLNLPANLRYHELTLLLTLAGSLADPTTIASNIKLKVGGVTIRDSSPDQIIRKAKLYGYTPATGEVPIFFSEPWFEDPRIAESFSWDMFGQGQFTLEITFLGAIVPGVQQVIAQVDQGRNTRFDKRLGKQVSFLRILKEKNQTFVFGGSGLAGNTQIDRTLPIRRLLIDTSTGTFTQVEVVADSVSVYNLMTIAQLSGQYAHQKLDNSQFKCPLVFDFDNLGRSSLTCQTLEVRLNPSAANTSTFLVIQEADRFA